MGNLLVNSNFDQTTLSSSDFAGYFSCPISVDTTFAHTGNNSLKCVTNSAVNFQGFIHTAPLGTIFNAAQVVPYTAAWFWVPTGTTLSFRTRVLNIANGGVFSENVATIPVVGNSDWQLAVLPAWTYTAQPQWRPAIEAYVTPAATGITFWADETYISATYMQTNNHQFVSAPNGISVTERIR